MLELGIKRDKDGLVLHVAVLSTGEHSLTWGLSRALCTGLEEALLHPQWSYWAFWLLLTPAQQRKSPTAVCKPQISKLELMRPSEREKLRTRQRGVKGSAHGCEELQPRTRKWVQVTQASHMAGLQVFHSITPSHHFCCVSPTFLPTLQSQESI